MVRSFGFIVAGNYCETEMDRKVGEIGKEGAKLHKVIVSSLQ